MVNENGQIPLSGKSAELEKLEWIQLNADMTSLHRNEGLREKLVRKTKENPMVPLGAGLTLLALTSGLVAMRKSNKRMSQLMMRFRIAAQGFTIVAIIGGIAFGVMKK